MNAVNNKTPEAPNAKHFGKSFFSAFISSGIAKYAGHPLDTIKTRIQITGNKVSLRGHFSSILQREGLYGFYKGASSPVLGTAPIMATLFASNDMAKRVLKDTSLPQNLKEFLPGCWAGFSTLFVVVPADLLKIKKQGLHNRVISYSELVRDIVTKNGILGLYKGFWISFVRLVPQYGIYFYSYDKFQQLFNQYYSPKTQNYANILMQKGIAGGLAGQVCCMIGYPVDLVRTYIQYHPESRSILGTIKYLYNEHGIGYFHRGCSVAMLRSFVVGSFTFATYEGIKNAIGETD